MRTAGKNLTLMGDVLGSAHKRFFPEFMHGRIFRLMALCVLASSLLGCISWESGGGERHMIVIGLGVMTVTNRGGTAVNDLRGVGLFLDEGLQAGWLHRHRVEIDPGKSSNVVISIQSTASGLIVTNYEMLHATGAGAAARESGVAKKKGD